MRPPTPLPQRAGKQLRQALKQAETKTEFQRVQCLWLRAALGLSANEVALAVGWAPTSVRRVQARYLREGEAALRQANRGGRRHENLSEEAERQLLEGFLGTAAQGGVLELKAIQAAYEAAVGHAVAKSTVYRMLARHGWRKIAPRPRHFKADPAAQAAFKKTAPPRHPSSETAGSAGTSGAPDAPRRGRFRTAE
jgi:transposase